MRNTEKITVGKVSQKRSVKKLELVKNVIKYNLNSTQTETFTSAGV